MITYQKNGETYFYVFVAGQDSSLKIWNVNSRISTTIDMFKVDRCMNCQLIGLYRRDKGSDREFTLFQPLSEDGKADKHISLPKDWRWGEKEYVGEITNQSFEEPSMWGWIGLGLGIPALFSAQATGGYLWIAYIAGIVGTGVGIMDMVRFETNEHIYILGIRIL